MAPEEDQWVRQAPGHGRQGHPRTADRSGTRSGAGQHYGVLQAVQRPHQGPRDGRPDDSGRHHRLCDRTFSFITKTPPAAVLLKKAAGIEKGSGTPNKDKKGKVTEKQIIQIATQKMPDLNSTTVEAAARSIRGTARSMGIEITA